MRLLAAAIVALPFLSAGSAPLFAQETPPRTFSLSGRAQATLAADWSQRFDVDPPPLAPLVSSAPRISFTDILVLENRVQPAALELAYSSNPFFGMNSTQLDTRVHASLVSDLFYLFFPPPRGCLSSAKSDFDAAVKLQEDQERSAKTDSSASAAAIRLERNCHFSVTPLDFFASQLSSRITYRGHVGDERVDPSPRSFYLPPMEQVEIDGKTFFIFEARADHALDFSEVQRFGLADNLQGARAHFFWAIGAPSPFPFLRDPQRKDRQIFHVVFACLGFDGEARDAFRALLAQAHFTP